MAKQQPQPQTKEKRSSVITPLIRVEGKKNILEEIFDGPEDDIPELKAVGYARVGSNRAGWVSYVVTFKGTKVIDVQVTEPELRNIVEETTRIDFVTNFMDQGL